MKLTRIGNSNQYTVEDHPVREREWIQIDVSSPNMPIRDSIRDEIVRRVNCHDELVAALMKARNFADNVLGYGAMSCESDARKCFVVRDEIDDVLSRAEGGAE